MDNKEEINAINIQLVALFFVLFADVISIIITYNQKLDLENKETMFESKELFKITLYNRILILVLSFVFLYINFKLYEIYKKKNADLKAYTLQIIASLLVIASGIIALYIVKLSDTEEIFDVENPII